MAFLGRPSAGDSPFAIGERAMRDTSSPQPPMQRNPTPKQPFQPAQGSLAAPSPYGNSSVSDEARRRYEERYARKRQEEEDKRRQEEEAAHRAANPPRQQSQQQQQQQQWGRPPQGPHGGGHPGQQQQQWAQPQFTQQQPPQSPSQPQFARPPPRGDSFRGSTYGQPPPRGASPANAQFNAPARGASPQHQSAAAYAQQHRQNSAERQQLQQQQQNFQQPANPRHSGQQVDPRDPRFSGNQQQFAGAAQHGGYQTPPPQMDQRASYHSPQQQQRQSQQGPPPQHQQPQQQGNYQTPTPPQSEQGGDQELRNLFNQFDASRTGQLSHWDLRRLLEKDATMEAREDCVKMLMNIFDTDRSGSINFMEFEGLYRYIQDWHGIFKRFDVDESGLIDRRELHAALQGFGFSLPADMVAKLEKRFAPPTKANEQPGNGISFDRFLMACVTVKHYTEAFRRFDPNNTGNASMDYNTFMDMVMDAPS